MAARGQKFSFMRLVNNAFPNFARDDPNDVDLSPAQADNLLRYQLALPNPRRLGEESILHAGVVGSPALSKKVFKALDKHSIISSSEDKRPVDTTAISKNFAHQLACISVHAQRKLVGLLFFWEEECTRWRLLDLEEENIRKAMQHDHNEHLELAMREVEINKRLLPSERETTTYASARDDEEPPAYTQYQRQ